MSDRKINDHLESPMMRCCFCPYRGSHPAARKFFGSVSLGLAEITSRFLFAALFLVLIHPAVKECVAEGDPPAQVLEQPKDSPVGLEQVWSNVIAALQTNDTATAVDNLELLKRLRNERGYEMLEPQSLELLQRSQQALSSHHLDEAAFLVRKAVELSPTSSRVLFKSLPLLDATGVRMPGVGSLWGQFWQGLVLLGRNRELSLKIIKICLYPALWAVTLGVLLTFVLSLCCNMHVVIAKIAKHVPVSIRGFVAAPAALSLVMAPLMGGPVTCILVWTLVALLFLRSCKWLPLCGGAVVVLWGAVIPIREHLSERISNPGVQALLRVSSGQYAPRDKAELEEFSVAREGDMAAQLLLGQVLRREGLYQDALRVLKNAQMSYRLNNGWVIAQVGIVQFLLGNLDDADKLFAEAQAVGMNSVEFWFNYSKIKFALTDTAQSREFFERALSLNRELTAELRAREDSLGLYNRYTIAEMHIPWRLLVPSILAADSDRAREYDARVAQVVPGANPMILIGIGSLLVILAMLHARGEARVRRLAFFSRYVLWKPLERALQFVPGGAWAVHERHGTCALILSVLCFLSFPFIAWPTDSAAVLICLPGIQPLYAAAVVLVALGICYVGYFLSVEDD